MRVVAVALGGIAVGAFAWKAIDPGFSKFFDDVLCKVRPALCLDKSCSRVLNLSEMCPCILVTLRPVCLDI